MYKFVRRMARGDEATSGNAVLDKQVVLHTDHPQQNNNNEAFVRYLINNFQYNDNLGDQEKLEIIKYMRANAELEVEKQRHSNELIRRDNSEREERTEHIRKENSEREERTEHI